MSRIGRFLRRTLKDGPVDLGDLRRLTPISSQFGLDRGTPIRRYYIESFLDCHKEVIGGDVLEAGDNTYTLRFGGSRVRSSVVLDLSSGNPSATWIADLQSAVLDRQAAFDCIICTQTLHVIYDVRQAISNVYRLLRPGGVVLASVPGISQISRYDADRWGDYWRFTSAAIRRLFEEVFPARSVEVQSYGNVLTAAAALYGLAAEEMDPVELATADRDYEVLIAVRAERPGVGV